MPRFEFSVAAARDLGSIDEYTAAIWGEAQAETYRDALELKLAQIARRPLIGRPRDDLAHGLRSALFQSHVIFYTPTEFGVFIVRVLHQRQDAYRYFS